VAGKLIFQMGYGGHIGFLQITRVAQSCHLCRFSRFMYWTHRSVNWTKS